MGISNEEALEIIENYSDFIKSHAPIPGCVSDAGKLPFTKEKIKEALLIGFGITDDKQRKEHLRVCYLLLADWQEGVGDVDQGLDYSKVDLKNLSSLSSPALKDQFAALKKWEPITQADRDKLTQELIDLGLM